MTIRVQTLADGKIRIRLQPELGKVRRLMTIFAVVAGIFASSFFVRISPWAGLLGLVPFFLIAGGMHWLQKKFAKPIEMMLDPENRKLSGPKLDYTFPHVGYLALDGYKRVTRSRGTNTQNSNVARVVRLSFVGKEADEAELGERQREVDARPESYTRDAPPPPGDGDVLLPFGSYAMSRTLCRELGHAMNLPLMDLTSVPARLLDADEQGGGLDALRDAMDVHVKAGPPPSGIRRKERADSFVLSHAPSALWLRALGFMGFSGMGLVLFVCSGLKLYIGIWPLLLSLLLLGRTRWTITPEGVSTDATWLGITISRRFFAYDDLEDVSAAAGKEQPCVRLVVGDNTHRIVVPRMEMAQYLAVAALNPPTRERDGGSPYR